MLFDKNDLSYLEKYNSITESSLEELSDEIYFLSLESIALPALISNANHNSSDNEHTQNNSDDKGSENKTYWERFKAFIKTLIQKIFDFTKKIFNYIKKAIFKAINKLKRLVLRYTTLHNYYLVLNIFPVFISGTKFKDPINIYKESLSEINEKYKNRNYIYGKISGLSGLKGKEYFSKLKELNQQSVYLTANDLIGETIGKKTEEFKLPIHKGLVNYLNELTSEENKAWLRKRIDDEEKTLDSILRKKYDKVNELEHNRELNSSPENLKLVQDSFTKAINQLKERYGFLNAIVGKYIEIITNAKIISNKYNNL